MNHSGPYHEVLSRNALIAHLALPHHVHGTRREVQHVVTPASELRTWRLDELRATHRGMHAPTSSAAAQPAPVTSLGASAVRTGRAAAEAPGRQETAST